MKYARVVILILIVLLSAHDLLFAVTEAEISEKKQAVKTNCPDIEQALAKGEQINPARISDVAERERTSNYILEFSVIQGLEKQRDQQQQK
jgi:hypothetical protein